MDDPLDDLDDLDDDLAVDPLADAELAGTELTYDELSENDFSDDDTRGALLILGGGTGVSRGDDVTGDALCVLLYDPSDDDLSDWDSFLTFLTFFLVLLLCWGPTTNGGRSLPTNC